jgi:flagellar capping protein FliD
MLSLREKTIKDRIGQIDRNIENKERLIDAKQKALTEQFSRLQGSLMRLQQQQAYMQANLGGGGGANPISQLLGG